MVARPAGGQDCRRRSARSLGRLLLPLVAALVATAAAAGEAQAITLNLDRDRAPERLVAVAVRLPYFSAPVLGRTWAVVDRVSGRRTVARLGPPGELLRRPRVADRNGDGWRDIFLEAHAGNSSPFGELWQWNGRRATRLWRSTSRPVDRVISPEEVLNFPIATRFPDEDGDGVHDVEQDAGVGGACRACAFDRILTVRWRFSPRAGRYVLLGVEGF